MSNDVAEITYFCGVCNAEFVEGEFNKSIQCNACLKWVHMRCSSLDRTQFKVLQQVKASAWFCPPCAKNPQSIVGGNIVLMLKNMLEKLKLDVQSDVKTELNKFNTELKDGLMNEVKVELQHIIDNNLAPIKNNISDCVKRLSLVENKLADSSSSTREIGHNNVAAKVNKLEMLLRRADIVMHGIPALVPNVDLRQIVINIGTKIGFIIENSDIQQCFRLRNKEMVLIKFVSVYKRDGLMAKYFKSKVNVCIKDVYPSWDVGSRIYLNDSLPKETLILKKYCKELVKNGKLVAAFVRRGDLFIIPVSGERVARKVFSKDDVPS